MVADYPGVYEAAEIEPLGSKHRHFVYEMPGVSIALSAVDGKGVGVKSSENGGRNYVSSIRYSVWLLDA